MVCMKIVGPAANPIGSASLSHGLLDRGGLMKLALERFIHLLAERLFDKPAGLLTLVANKALGFDP
jgi:hypothetical protein